jgi:serine/arginine repetitive matrix protein 1
LKVNTKKVAMDAIRPWITEKITKLVNFEDEVLINYIFSLLEEQVLFHINW